MSKTSTDRRWLERLRNSTPAVLFAILPAAVILILPALTPWLGGGQTWVVSTQSLGVQLSFRGQSNVWPLSNVTLCDPRQQPLRKAPEQSDTALCDARRFEVTRPEHLHVAWTEGTSVDLRKTSENTEILVRNGNAQFPTGTLISVPDSELKRLGSLSFTAPLKSAP